VNEPPISPNRDVHTNVTAADGRLRLSGDQSKNRRPSSRGSAKRPSRSFVKAQPEGPEWDAVQEMLLASRPRFVGLAYTILRNKEDAEDAVQDALLSAYRHLHCFEGRSALTTWFTRIVLNAALVIRRKRRNSRIDSFPEACSTDDTHWMETIPAPQPDPEVSFALGEASQMINILLEKMSPMNRQAFTMTYYDEMSNEEAGALLGIPKGTFKSRLSRARQHLMDQVHSYLVAPIRRVPCVPFSSIRRFSSRTARPAGISSPEIAFS
jgi:RNA polymerase sigma-70 factor, ECF subfamily